MANVSVDYQSMADQATKLTNAKNQIEEELATLKTQVDTLVGAGFVTDSASKSFQHSYEFFTTGMKQTISGMDGMAAYLNKAAQTFQDVDTQLASALNQ